MAGMSRSLGDGAGGCIDLIARETRSDPLIYSDDGNPAMVDEERYGSAKYTLAINQNNVIIEFQKFA